MALKTPQSILGESFDEYVSKQINLRQKKLGQIQKDDKILTYESGKNPWIRLCSSVDIDGNVAATFSSKYNGGASVGGNSLAQVYTLYGGVSSGLFGANPGELKGGVISNNYQSSYVASEAYGFDSSNQYGLSPMPGITSIDVVSNNQGSLREATIKITCYNISQFETIELLFLRLKYTLLLEWGHSMYFENGTEDLRTTPINDVYTKFLNTGKLNPSQGQTYLKRILELIEFQREESSGNYDAFLGWVTNYEWEMQPNGVYNITVKATSHGDIIESLTVTTPRSDENGGEDVKNQDRANNSILGKILNSLKTALDGDDWFTFETDGFPVDTLDINDPFFGQPQFSLSYFSDKSVTSSSNIARLIKLKNQPYINPFYDIADKEVVRVDPDSGDPQYYITLGALLRIIESFCLKYDTSGIPIFAINWDYRVNYSTNYDPNIMSSDIRVCYAFGEKAFVYPNETYNNAEASTRRLLFIGDQFLNTSDFTIRYMYTFLNIDFLLTTLTNNVDSEGNLSIYDFLTATLTATNEALGNYLALELYHDSDINTLYVVDRSTPVKPDTPPTRVNVGLVKPNQGTFVKQFSIKSEITPNLASQIAIGAQANNTDVGVESIAFSRWNRGLTDRIIPNKISPKTNTTEDETFLGLKKDTILYLKNLAKGYWDEGDNIFNLAPSVNDYQKQVKAKKIRENTNIPSPSFIPISLNLTLDGISGIKIFQKYTITEDYLPKSYRDNIEFIVKGISHTIDSSGWTTKIESLSIPKGNEKISGGASTNSSGISPGATTSSTSPQQSPKTFYPEKPLISPPPSTKLTYSTAKNYLTSKYGESLAKAIFAIMFAEASKEGEAFNSAGGHNYAGVQTDSRRWPSSTDPYITGRFVRRDSERLREFAAFNGDRPFLDFMANRIRSKFDTYISNPTPDNWVTSYIQRWWSPGDKATITKGTPKYNNKLATFNDAIRRFNQA